MEPHHASPRPAAPAATLPAPVPAPAGAASGGRLLFVDNLRIALTVLVVLHHLAVQYLVPVGWYYQELTRDPAVNLLGYAFVMLNQGWFMGVFFLLSGVFTPRSYDRKGAGGFVRDRLLRLGVPVLAFAFVLSPLATAPILFTPVGREVHSLPQYLAATVNGGPLWFAELLLLFAVGYAGWRRCLRPAPVRPLAEPRPPTNRALVLFVLGLAVVTYLWRIAVPIGLAIPLTGAATVAYLPQYLSFFVLGLVAYRRGWLRAVTDRTGRVGWIVALGAFLFLFLPAALSSPHAQQTGHGTWQSALYALWDSTFAPAIGLGLLTFFRRHLAVQGRLRRHVSAHAFGVYVLHAVVLAWLGIALRGLPVDPAVKFPIGVALGVPLAFAVAALVRRLPGVRRVL